MKDLNFFINKTFGRLKVIKFAFKKYDHNYFECQCSCGNIKTVRDYNLEKGATKSCGCITKTHGQTHSTTYNIWATMLQRCFNPKNKEYHYYGGIGN